MKNKKLRETKIISVNIETYLYDEITARYKNFSEWVREQAKKDLSNLQTLNEMEVEKKVLQNEADIFKEQAKQKEIEAKFLEAQILERANPSKTLLELKENYLLKAVSTINSYDNLEKKVDKAKVYAEIIKRNTGFDISVEDLLKKAEQKEIGGMFG